ncbi:MAG TPA: hypothetical protein VN026_02530 [Bacteroidia bacterium]|jgi:hypothetical protein|nr:hypothetical protein [Bacteroidia bacterium]
MIKQLLENKARLLKIGVFIAISFFYLERSLNDFPEPFIKGDGIEYILMTEALHNHGTPDITFQDMIKFKKRFSKYHSWNDLYGHETYDHCIDFFKIAKDTLKESTHMGFFCNKNKKWVCQHFFFYSLINLPAYSFAKQYGPIRTFYITNAIFVLITCFVLLFFTPFSLINQILSALCFCFTSCYWYLGWHHTEIYTSCLVACSLVALFRNKNNLAIFLLALACLQNQPLTLLLGLYCLIKLHKTGFNIKNIITTGMLACIALIPPIYYYINFETTNLIKDAGYLDTKYITLNRVSGFYTDLNQGMILTIPLVLIFYVPLLFIEARKMFRKQVPFDFSILIPITVIIISTTVASMGNWNHGMAIINRYATWLSITILIHTFYLTHKLKATASIVLFNCFFVTQVWTTLYHQQFNENDWSSSHFTPLAKWVLRMHESWYNPDPVIFAFRNQPAVSLWAENSPLIYFYHKQVKKILVHREKIDNLKDLGFSDETIANIRSHIHYNYDWGYVPMKYFKSTLTGEQIYASLRKKKVDAVYVKIFTSTTWMNQIREKAKSWGKTFEEACMMDAEYIVSTEEQRQAAD